MSKKAKNVPKFCVFVKKKYLCRDKKQHNMRGKLFIIPFVLTVLFIVPTVSRAETAIEIIDNEYQNISISVNASTVHVTGANGQTMYIYNVAGVRVLSVKIEGADRHYDLNLPKGCYIVKIGKTVRKISIK